jgi:hypothetical protein
MDEQEAQAVKRFSMQLTEPSGGVKADARQNTRGQGSHTLCRVNHARYSHVVNTKRVRNHERVPLSITNKSRKCLILGPAREIRSRSVSSGEPLFLVSRTSAWWRLTQSRRGLLAPCAVSALNSAHFPARRLAG